MSFWRVEVGLAALIEISISAAFNFAGRALAGAGGWVADEAPAFLGLAFLGNGGRWSTW